MVVRSNLSIFNNSFFNKLCGISTNNIVWFCTLYNYGTRSYYRHITKSNTWKYGTTRSNPNTITNHEGFCNQVKVWTRYIVTTCQQINIIADARVRANIDFIQTICPDLFAQTTTVAHRQSPGIINLCGRMDTGRHRDFCSKSTKH